MLLTGLYRPTGGEILFDGVPLSRIDPTELRRQFGVVLQESYLFRDSIRRNISLVHPGVGMPAIRAATEAAAIDEDIAAMPMGYDTQVAERGQALSGGQRQRLSIARALAGQPPCSCWTRPPATSTWPPSAASTRPSRRCAAPGSWWPTG
ncbi:hypothetical protein GCM10027614_82530 [Micromonospora vulcania]